MSFKEICEGLHLLARPMLATAVTVVLGCVVVVVPDVPIEKLAVISGTAIAYVGIKWTGNRIYPNEKPPT